MKKTKILSLLLAGVMTFGTAAYGVILGGDTAVVAEAAGGVDMWFDHVTVKTLQKDTASTGMTSYHMYMAKNEIENFQFFLSPDEKGKFDVSVTDFVNESGDKLACELYFEHYFTHLENGKMPDALPPVTKAVEIDAGVSQGFYGKVKTTADTPAGTYTATVTVAKDGAAVKTGEVTLTVWDFTLTEETPFTTVTDIGKFGVYSHHGIPDGDDGTLYKNYYDFALENRICAYTLPYDILSDEVNEYLDNPRVNGFMIGGDYNGLNVEDTAITSIYEKLSKNPDWFDKGIWYYVDEPTEMGKLNQIKAAGEKLAKLYPGYQMVSPYFFNIQVTQELDQIAFMAPYINVWCTKINAWTPADTTVPGAIHMLSQAQINKNGDYASRMEKEVAEGDKNWVYYCWEPLGPYTTFDASRQTLEQRVALWQAMDNDTTGLLYFTSTEWTGGMWRTIHKINAGGELVYGDGILLYPGVYPGAEPLDGPISSMRFESLRDGIEDYMYLDMAKELVAQGLLNEDMYEEIMDIVTVSAVEWCKDSDKFYDVRVALGNLIESQGKANANIPGEVDFKESSDFVAADNYVGGAVPGTNVLSVISSLKNINNIAIYRGETKLGLTDTVLPGDVVQTLNEEKWTIIIKGSVNGDDKINLSDVSMILQKIAGWSVTIDEIAGDVNSDGKLNLSDVTAVLKKIAGWDLAFDMTPVIPAEA